MDRVIGTARECGDVDVHAGREPVQMGWYRHAAGLVRGRSVLDVGCGLGEGLKVLAAVAAEATGQDLDERLAAPDVFIGPLSAVPSKSVDVVVSIDVIEHVPDPADFVAHLARIAREGIFITTPNWTATRCQWPYHLREYKPKELAAQLAPAGRVTLFKGSQPGDRVFQVRHDALYFLLNDLRVFPLTAFPSRVLNRLLPAPGKIWSNLGAWVAVS